MKAQTSLPDIITLQEIGTKSATWISQPCLVEGAASLSDARTVTFSDAYHAHLAATGKTSAPATHYSDHRAQMLRVKY